MKAVIIDKVSVHIGPELEKYGISVDYKMRPNKSELIELLPEYDLLIMRVDPKIDREVLDAGTRLKAIAVCSVGVNHIDLAYAREKGIAVQNAPGANANAVAELAITKMLELSRMTCSANVETKVEKIWNKYRYIGDELRYKTLGIVGLGTIGRRVAQIAHGFDMKTIAYDPYLTPADAADVQTELLPLEEVLKRCDYLTLHVPLTKETQGLISRDQIALMKDGSYIINTSRGGVLDEQAAYEFMESGKLKGVGIDVLEAELTGELAATAVLESPLYACENTVVSPHIGGGTVDAYDAIGRYVVDNLVRTLNLQKV